MKILRGLSIFAAVFCALSAGCASSPRSNPEIEATIRSHFEEFGRAFEARDGEHAANLISRASLEHYNTLLDMARHAEREALEELSLADQYLVLCIRYRMPREQALELTPGALYAEVVRRGWLGQVHKQAGTLDTITVSGDTASATLANEGAAAPKGIRFSREAGAWKIDTSYQTDVLNAEMEKALDMSRLPEDKFLVHILSITTLQNVSADVWEPLAAQKSE